jgi:glycosyltransferase involved in cell wall biosynthesis
MALLSTIVPCYNEEENILPYYEEFMKNRSFFEKNGLSYELIYVDDGSKDGTLQAIKKLIATDPECACALLFQELREGGRDVRRHADGARGLCLHHGLRPAGSAVAAA